MSATRSPITTHVLDVSLGRPARDVPVQLARLEAGAFVEIARGVTDADGRAGALLAPGTIARGTYKITFTVAPYFASSGRPSFYPHVDIVFAVEASDEHYHVPLLVSPWSYSTYRGS